MRRILAIRLQATGDVVITLAYLNAVKRRQPEIALDLLTREETASIPRALDLFERVHAIGGGRSFKKQCLHAAALFPRLLVRGYDVVLDLQNNEISRAIRRGLRPRVQATFDKTSPRSAGERTARTIEEAGLGLVEPDSRIKVRDPDGDALLAQAGARAESRLVLLNPAGAFPTRHWPVENYVSFARHWQRLDVRPTQFLLLGLPGLRARTDPIAEALGPDAVDLVGRTTAAQAFGLVRRTDLALSEDSGLMHMAWVSGVPTLALFGSSRADWSRPLGERSLCLDSSDLDCGACMAAECLHGDVRCLTRYGSEHVAELAFDLMGERR